MKGKRENKQGGRPVVAERVEQFTPHNNQPAAIKPTLCNCLMQIALFFFRFPQYSND